MSVQVKGSGTIGGLDEGLVVSGIVTSSTQINVGSNIKLGNAGIITATSFVGDVDIAAHIRHTGDTDTKISFDTNIIHLDTNNSERLRITSAGQMVMGATTSKAKFEIKDNGYSSSTVLQRISGDDDNPYALIIANDTCNSSADRGLQFFVSDSGEHYIRARASSTAGNNNLRLVAQNNIILYSGSSETERLRITSDGIIVTGGETAPSSTDVGSIFLKGGADLGWLTSSGSMTFNAYYQGGWKYVTTGTSHILWGDSGGFNFSTASSGSAGGAISYSRAMKIHTNNRISIGDGNSTTPLGALHINTKTAMGTDTALWIGDNTNKRYLAINQVSNSEQFSEMKLQFNDNGTRSVLKLSNPYGPAGYGTAILWQGYNDGQQGMILCQSEGANNAASTMHLNSSSGTFLQGNSSRHVTMPQQPAFSATRSGGAVSNGNVIVFNVEDFDTGGHYNNSTGEFTAPTAGKYQFSVCGMASGGDSDFQLRIQKNGASYFNNNGSGRGRSTFEPYGFTVLMNLAANDTVRVYVYSSNASATFYGSGTTWNRFSGSLIA